MIEQYDVAIIGSGVSGLGAAIYAGRFQLKTIVIGDKPGGTIILTNDIANYPGFSNITGIELSDRIKKHALDYNVELVDAQVTNVERCVDKCFKLRFKGKQIISKTLIFATGTKWRKLNVPGEDEFANKGVHYCALCDGAFYKKKIVAVVGGSDSAAKESLLLTQYAAKVYIIARGDKIRPEPINAKRVEENKKIEVITSTNVKEIKGDKFVNSVMLDKKFNGSFELKTDAVFIDVGHIPLTDLAKSIGVELDKRLEIKIDRKSRTNLPGVFACGDATDTHFKQAITGVAEGVTAAYSAFTYLNENSVICPCNDEE